MEAMAAAEIEACDFDLDDHIMFTTDYENRKVAITSMGGVTKKTNKYLRTALSTPLNLEKWRRIPFFQNQDVTVRTFKQNNATLTEYIEKYLQNKEFPNNPQDMVSPMVRKPQTYASMYSPMKTLDISTATPPSVAIPPDGNRHNQQVLSGEDCFDTNDDAKGYSSPSAEKEKEKEKDSRRQEPSRATEASVDSTGEQQDDDCMRDEGDTSMADGSDEAADEEKDNHTSTGAVAGGKMIDKRPIEDEATENVPVAPDRNVQLWLHRVSTEDAAQLPASFDYITSSERMLSARCPHTLSIQPRTGFVPAAFVPEYRSLHDNYNTPSWRMQDIICLGKDNVATITGDKMMTLFPRKPNQGACGIMVFHHDEYAIDRVFWFIEHVEPNVTNQDKGAYWFHILTRMWSADDHEQMEIYRRRHIQTMLRLLRKNPNQANNTMEIQTLGNYLRNAVGSFSRVEQVQLLLKVYHWSLGMPVMLFTGNHPLLPGKRFCEGPSAYRVVHDEPSISATHPLRRYSSKILLFQHERRDTDGRQYVKTIDLLLPPPPTSRIHFLATDFWPSLVNVGYVPRYEPCFFYEGEITLKKYGVHFYLLSKILDPNELRRSVTQTLEDWEVPNTLSLERVIMQSLIDPCLHAVPEYSPRDHAMIQAAHGLFREMVQHYGDNISPHRYHRLSPTELVEPQGTEGVAAKINIYSRILRRRILLIALNSSLTMTHAMLQQPLPGLGVQWPILFVGYCGISSSACGTHHRRIFAPSHFCGEGRRKDFPKSQKTPSPKLTPDFMSKSKTFEDLKPLPGMEPAYHIRADIDGLTALAKGLVQLITTFVSTGNDQSMRPAVSLRRMIRPSTKEAVCRYDAQLWEIKDKGVTTRKPILPYGSQGHNSVEAQPKGKCNLFHLPTIWIGSINYGSIL
jgi:hypothetical protein